MPRHQPIDAVCPSPPQRARHLRRRTGVWIGIAGLMGLAIGSLVAAPMVTTLADQLTAASWTKAMDAAKAPGSGLQLSFEPLHDEPARLVPTGLDSNETLAKHLAAGGRVTVITASGAFLTITVCGPTRAVQAEASEPCIDPAVLLRQAKQINQRSL